MWKYLVCSLSISLAEFFSSYFFLYMYCSITAVKTFLGEILSFAKKYAPAEVSRDISAKLPAVDKLIDEAAATPTPESTDTPKELFKPCMPLLDILKKLIEDIVGGDAAKTVVAGAAVDACAVKSSNAIKGVTACTGNNNVGTTDVDDCVIAAQGDDRVKNTVTCDQVIGS